MTQTLDAPLVLHPDVELTPASQLPDALRVQVEAAPGDVCVTRPRSRLATTVVDTDVAALLEAFREPSSIVDAVLLLAARRGRDPLELLDRSFAALSSLVEDGVLVLAASNDSAPVEPLVHPGDRVDGAVVLELVHLLADTEVHRGRDDDGTDVAVKLARPGAAPEAVAALGNEAAVLARLDGTVTPRLLRTGSRDGRPYLVTTWRPGLDLATAAADARAVGGPEGRAELVGLVVAVLSAYAALHGQGVLHGDVHPRNAVVDADGRVHLLDLGLAVVPDVAWRGPRGGIDLFRAPEHAAVQLAGGEPPPPTASSEQYGLGALVYLLLTGAHTRSFAVTPAEMLREVVEEPPAPFADHGVDGLGAVERVVRRALAKDPHERHPSVAAFRDALAEAAGAAREPAGGDRPPAWGRTTGNRGPGGAALGGPWLPARRAPALLDDVLRRVRPGGEVYRRGLPAPSASVTYGAAGVAYALLRVARAREDAELLAHADVWASRAEMAVAQADAFWDREHGVVPEVFGTCSLYHHAPGVHAVRALVAHAVDDRPGLDDAVSSYVAAASVPTPHADLAFGAAGLVVGSALLLDLDPGEGPSTRLRTLGDAQVTRLVASLDRPARDGEQPALVGAAHGRAGVLAAMLRWCQATGAAPPAVLPDLLEELARQAEPAGRGLRWPRVAGSAVDDSLLSASWCNGAAGLVHTWLLADAVLGDGGDGPYAALARRAAWEAYDDVADAPGDLCCGLAGRAYALVEMHRRTGEASWWERARRLGELAARHPRVQPHRSESLFHGELGIAVLGADLEAGEGPAGGRMPLFAGDGWHPGT